MKGTASFLKLAALVTSMLVLAAVQTAAQNFYEYNWTGGKSGFSGKIFLDAPSSASSQYGGTVADVLPGSYLTTPLGSYPIFDAQTSAEMTPWVPHLQWDQTSITHMWLLFGPDPQHMIFDPYYGLPSVGLAEEGYFGYAPSVQAGVVLFFPNSSPAWESAYANDDFTGNWLAAPVPEPATFALVILGVASQLSLRARNRLAVGRK